MVPFDGNQYLVTFTEGLAFLVGRTTTPKLAAVLDTWRGTATTLSALLGRWAHEPVVRVFRQEANGTEIQNWWISADSKWASLSGRDRNDVEWIGTHGTDGILFDKTAGEMIRVPLGTTASFTTAPAGTVTGRVADMRRLVGDTDTLYIELPATQGAATAFVAPVIDGVKALYLSGGNGADLFSITSGLWNHYRAIVVNGGDADGTLDTVRFEAGIDSGRMAVGRNDDGGLVIWDTESGAQLILEGVFDPDEEIRARHQNLAVRFADTAPISVATLAASVVGAGGGDTLRTGDTDDTIRGGDGNDRIYAGGGRDILHGEGGADDIHGGSGDDVIVGGDGADTLFGDEGEDTVVYRGDGANGTGVSVDLGQGLGRGADAEGDLYHDIEHVQGTSYADTLSGDEADNHLFGGAGDDTIDGRGGDDELHAGSGRDDLKGGEGRDIYVLDDGGQHVIRNEAEDGKIDTVRMDAAFNALAALRFGRDLVISASATFSVRVLRFFDDRKFRHIRFVSSDGVLFEIADEDLSGTHHLVTKTVLGLDRAGVAGDLTWSPTNTETFANSRIRLSNFVGSATHANTLVLGNDDTTVKTGIRDDVITTGSGDDLVDAGNGADTVHAHGGNDIIRGGAGADAIHGGDGIDTVTFDGNPFTGIGVAVDLEEGTGSGSDAEGDTYTAVENADGTPYADVLRGSLFANVLSGRGGNDKLYGGFGNDVLAPGDGSDRVDGGVGWDTVRYGDLAAPVWLDLSKGVVQLLDDDGIPNGHIDHLISIENVEGTPFSDMLMGDAKDNLVIASFGHDRIDLKDGHDRIDYSLLAFEGAKGVWIDLEKWKDGTLPLIPEVVTGHDDYLIQWVRNVEEVTGSKKNDRLYGTADGDTLSGGIGLDFLDGRGGDDRLIGSGDGDVIDGGEGEDTLDYRDMDTGIHASLVTGIAAAVDRFTNIENLSGSLFDDTLTGDDGANVLEGRFGFDVLAGNGGNDTFIGIGDGDLMIGGAGRDTADFRKATRGVALELQAEAPTAAERTAWEGRTARPDLLVEIEQVFGSKYADEIVTGDLNETVRAGDGDDDITASSAGYGIDLRFARMFARLGLLQHNQDTLDGGDGFDVVRYTESNAGILANLGLGKAARDMLVSIEGIEGSRNDDTIYGSRNADLFIGGDGNDFYDGGAGIDTADYSGVHTTNRLGIHLRFIERGVSRTRRSHGIGTWNAPLEARAEVSFTSGTETFVDELVDVEIFKGTDLADSFVGGNHAETFVTKGGNDYLLGGRGNDRLEGGDGNDAYAFRRGDGQDSILDTGGLLDRLSITGYSNRSDIVVWGDGEDLRVSGRNGDEVTIEKGRVAENAIDRIQMGSHFLTHAAALRLVDAMAQFSAANGIEITSADDIRQNVVLTAIASSAWNS